MTAIHTALAAQTHRRTIDPVTFAKRREPFVIHRVGMAPVEPGVIDVARQLADRADAMPAERAQIDATADAWERRRAEQQRDFWARRDAEALAKESARG